VPNIQLGVCRRDHLDYTVGIVESIVGELRRTLTGNGKSEVLQRNIKMDIPNFDRSKTMGGVYLLCLMQ
jgi:predicted translin family RNA/ssDNA-binding protein